MIIDTGFELHLCLTGEGLSSRLQYRDEDSRGGSDATRPTTVAAGVAQSAGNREDAACVLFF